MTPGGHTRVRLSLSDLLGLGALQLALPLLLAAWLTPLDVRWAALPLIAYLGLTALAPFLPGFGYFLPIISRRPGAAPQVALTFDDGPDPVTTPALLALLAARGLRATFFVVGERVRAHPELARAILAAGHELGNHSDHHDPLLMLRGPRRLAAEVAGGQAALAALGIHCRVFRPPVGITNPRLRAALEIHGLRCVNWSVRARDGGNRWLEHLAARILRRVRGGDIVLLHDTAPRAGVDRWVAELERLLDGLHERGLEPVALGRLLGWPINEPTAAAVSAHPVRDFYDDLARGYDAEHEHGGGGALHRLEQALVLARLPEVLTPGARVLELGAGTGRYAVPLAALAREVVAVDVSPQMLARLQERADAAGCTNIRTVCADLTRLGEPGPFELVCSFSALEYVSDLGPVLRDSAARLAPGGRLYLTTARSGFLRFFVQLGNAVRQGLWLHGRRAGELRRALEAAGLQVTFVRAVGYKVGPFGGLLLEALASRPLDERGDAA